MTKFQTYCINMIKQIDEIKSDFIQFDDFQTKAQSFDLLVSTTTTSFSNLIQFCQGLSNGISKNYSHVALILRDDVFPQNAVIGSTQIQKNKLYILESVIYTQTEGPNISGEYVNGVQMRNLNLITNSYFKLLNEKSMVKIGYAKLNNETRKKINELFSSENIKQKFLDNVNNLIGTPYKFNLIEQAYVPFHRNPLVAFIYYIKKMVYPQNNTLLCSELIGQIYKDLNLLEPRVNINFILPEDFLPKNANSSETCDFDKEIKLFYCEPVELKK